MRRRLGLIRAPGNFFPAVPAAQLFEPRFPEGCPLPPSGHRVIPTRDLRKIAIRIGRMGANLVEQKPKCFLRCGAALAARPGCVAPFSATMLRPTLAPRRLFSNFFPPGGPPSKIWVQPAPEPISSSGRVVSVQQRCTPLWKSSNLLRRTPAGGKGAARLQDSKNELPYATSA